MVCITEKHFHQLIIGFYLNWKTEETSKDILPWLGNFFCNFIKPLTLIRYTVYAMKKITLLLLFLLSLNAFAQKEDNYWYFGNNAGIHFLDNGTVQTLTHVQMTIN